ncbi:hypothetical protein M5E87_13590 [Flavonifractor plautii]|nr:hypothetical protein M5E87_13590 [Flavonifractor plautii]
MDQVCPLYLSGVVNTLLLAVAATVLGCLIGLACGLLNTIPIHPQDRLPRRVLLAAPGRDPYLCGGLSGHPHGAPGCVPLLRPALLHQQRHAL